MTLSFKILAGVVVVLMMTTLWQINQIRILRQEINQFHITTPPAPAQNSGMSERERRFWEGSKHLGAPRVGG